MCTVSMVTGHYYEKWPDYRQFPQYQYPDYAELVRKARLYDEMTKQHDCPDPKKEEWHRGLVEFMREKCGLEPK